MDRKIADAQSAGVQHMVQQKEAFRIPHYFIDTNQHVNNAKYILLAEEILPTDFHPVRMRAEYKKPAVYGDVLYPSVWQQPHCRTVRFGGTDKKPYVIMEFYEHV